MLSRAPDAVERAQDPWQQLPQEAGETLRRHGVMREFPTGQALCHERQIPDRVLILRSGRVKITGSTPEGREVVLAFRGPGELVGEMSALDDQPRSATVVALEPVGALAIAPADFRGLITAHPSIAMAVLSLLSRRLRDADAKRIESVVGTSQERVASRLLELCDRFGEREGDVIRITLPLSQEELASWAGASVESVGRALQTMRGLGWITTGRRDIGVLDLPQLRRAASHHVR
jgi:CRP/FNR family transcriptional regulator, cyclic AMP receptor protein